MLSSLFAGIITYHWASALFLFLLGIGLLWLSSELVMKKISPVAGFLGVSELVVTILGVSILSSLPELTISLFATLKGNYDISIGNIVGSNFVTLTFVTSICAFFAPFTAGPEIKERESSWMIFSSILCLILGLDGILSRMDGLVLIILYIPYVLSVISQAKKEMRTVKNERDRPGGIVLHIFGLIAGILGIIAGASIALQSGENIGLRAGITPLTLGVLIFALGTSLPELAIALNATLKKKTDVTIGEIYASNIVTAMLILGICCIAAPIKISPSILRVDLPFLILAGAVVQIFINTGNRFVRFEAVIVFCLYVYFVLIHFLKLPFSSLNY